MIDWRDFIDLSIFALSWVFLWAIACNIVVFVPLTIVLFAHALHIVRRWVPNGKFASCLLFSVRTRAHISVRTTAKVHNLKILLLQVCGTFEKCCLGSGTIPGTLSVDGGSRDCVDDVVAGAHRPAALRARRLVRVDRVRSAASVFSI